MTSTSFGEAHASPIAAVMIAISQPFITIGIVKKWVASSLIANHIDTRSIFLEFVVRIFKCYFSCVRVENPFNEH